jgi:hypothetical protein
VRTLGSMGPSTADRCSHCVFMVALGTALFCPLRQQPEPEAEVAAVEKAEQVAEAAPPAKRKQPPPEPGPSSGSSFDQPIAFDSSDDEGSSAVQAVAVSARPKPLPPLTQMLVNSGGAARSPPTETELASVDGVGVGDVLWVEFSDDGLWYRGIVKDAGRDSMLVFDDGEVWRARRTWTRKLADGQWRRVAVTHSAAATSAAATLAAAVSAVAASAAANLELDGESEDEEVAVDHRLRKIGWTARQLEDGTVLYQGRLRQGLPQLFTAKSVSEAVSMYDSAQVLPDSEVMGIYGGDSMDMGRGGRKRPCRQPSQPQLREATVNSKPTAAQRASANWLLGDFCHGIGGFTVVCKRLNGLLAAACDKEQAKRAAFSEHLKDLGFVLDSAFHTRTIAEMADHCLFPLDLITAGLPCQPFSRANTIADGSVWNRPGGTAFAELVTTLRAREQHGVRDAALCVPMLPHEACGLSLAHCRAWCGVVCRLLENVEGILKDLSEEKLSLLKTAGYEFRIFQADATIFGCATTRPRVAIVAFRDAAALRRFGNGPRPTHSRTGVPLSQMLNPAYNDTLKWAGRGPKRFASAVAPPL